MAIAHTSTLGSRDNKRFIGRAVIIGDSHIHAIKDALQARGSTASDIRIEAKRLLKAKQLSYAASDQGDGLLASARKFLKGGARKNATAALGDISFDEALKIARRLGPADVLVSVIGGNQHAVFSTIQHPQPFDFMLPGEPAENGQLHDTELVPFRALYPYFRTALRDGDGETIAMFRKATSARMIHLLAPPPKRMNDWIEQHHDTMFVEEGLSQRGVSKPELRLRFWHLQNRAIREICDELRVEVLGTPHRASDPDGFLARAYYAGDATHANPRYGELVLQQLEAMLRHQIETPGAVS
jgi:hypothetical protein